jgi:hypothetical protein
MENNASPILKNFQRKKSKKKLYLNSSKNHTELLSLIKNKNIILNSEIIPGQFPSQVDVRKYQKFNSIDNKKLLYKTNRNSLKIDTTASPLKTRKIPKNDNYPGNILGIFEDEPHLKKSVFKRKNNNKIFKNFNRKVSFLSPSGGKAKQKILKANKSSNFLNANLDSTDKKVKEDDLQDEQSYGYDKHYNINYLKKTRFDDSIKTALFTKKDFEGRNIRRKHTTKTYKSNNMSKITNIDKNTALTFKRDFKKKNTSKTSDKKFKKKMKDKDKEKSSKEKNNKEKTSKEKNNNPKITNININSTINVNAIDRQKSDKYKQKKCATMIDKEEKKNDNKKSTNSESKNKKKEELSPKKSIENVDTLVQVVEEDKKKKKKNFCCIPFLICFTSNEENENIL